MARQEKSLAVCLEILQDYTAKDFSLFAVLTTADFYSHNSQFHFLSHNPNDMKQWHATLSCLSSTAWGKVLLFVGCRLTDQKKHHSLICRTILFATPPQERSHWCKPQRPLSCLAAQPWRKPDARSMDKPYSSFIGISLKAVPFLYAISIFLKHLQDNNCIHFSEMSMR